MPSDLLKKALEVLSGGKDLAVVIGPRVFRYGDIGSLVKSLMALAGRKPVNIIPLYFGANARGALEMGVFPEIEPGGVRRRDKGLGLEDILKRTKTAEGDLSRRRRSLF